MTTPTDTSDTEGSLDDLATPSRSRIWWWIGAAALLAGGTVAAIVLLGNGSDEATAGTVAAPTFEQVVQTDLIQMDSFDGTLGTETGDPVASPIAGTVTTTAEVGTMIEQGDVFLTVNNEPVVLLYGDLPAYRTLTATDDSMTLAGGTGGVVTEVVAAGETIEQGDVLYRVDGEPVVVMYGDIPAYRTLRDLSDNMTGADVLQLETALVALGYDPDSLASVDEEFTDYTETMVERWQEDLGVEETGIVALGDVIFIPESSRGARRRGRGRRLRQCRSAGGHYRDGRSSPRHRRTPARRGVWLLSDTRALRGRSVGQRHQGGGHRMAGGRWYWMTDGVVDLGEVVFLPATVRSTMCWFLLVRRSTREPRFWGSRRADKFVTFDLPAADQGLVVVGQEVMIEMPDGSDAAGTVVEIDSVATGGQGSATFEVKIVLAILPLPPVWMRLRLMLRSSRIRFPT